MIPVVRSTQRGFGVVHIIVIILLIGAAWLAAFKIGKPYGDAKVMQQIVERTLRIAKDEPTLTAGDIAKRIFDQANVQTIAVDYDAIQVKLIIAGEYSVKIDLLTKIPLWKGAFLGLELGAQGATK